MATPQALRTAITDLSVLAANDLAVLWRSVSTPNEARDALADVLPPLVETYALASATLSADWYDEVRDLVEARGRFRAIPAEPERLGTDKLTGWAVGPLYAAEPDWRRARVLVEGGMQLRIANASRYTVAGSSIEDPAADGWQRQGSGSCGFCSMLVGRGAVYSEATADFAAHDHCFPAGVVTTGPSVERGFRRWYEGELVVVRLSSGHEVPVTPNHPILTPTGWVEAGRLREGDDVVERGGADLASLNVPHEHDVPTPIEDVWGAASMNLLRRVPVAPEDFHGDFGVRQGDVDVVAPYRLLANVRDAALGHKGAQAVRSGAYSSAVLHTLAPQGDGLLPGIRALHSADSGVSSCGVRPSFLGRHPHGSQAAGFRRAPYNQSSILQPTSHGRSRDAVVVGHRENTAPSLVQLMEIGGRREPVVSWAPTLGARYDAPALERDTDAVRTLASQVGRNLIERLSGGVLLSRVVQLSRRDFAGHVFNLQTAEGWYTANGVVVSNCKCSAVPAFSGQPRPVKPYTPSARQATDADRARVREYLRTH